MKPMSEATRRRIYAMTLVGVYPLYRAKIEKKGRAQAELDEVIRWLTGYTQAQLEQHLSEESTFETFFADAPVMNPNRTLITGSVCGVKLAEIDDPLVLNIRYLDKLVDELAQGRPLEKILRSQVTEG